MPHIEATDGTRFYYYDGGGTGTVAVFVHAWSLSSTMWEYQLAAFREAGYRCIALDRRGHGRSDVPGTGYDLDTLAGDLAQTDTPQAMGTDLQAELRSIDIRTLVVHGDADASAPIDFTGRPTAALLPNSSSEVHSGAPHGLYVTEKDRLSKELLAFGAAR
jgi:pimeloyl-ACP methyl ester carboxylesterase